MKNTPDIFRVIYDTLDMAQKSLYNPNAREHVREHLLKAMANIDAMAPQADDGPVIAVAKELCDNDDDITIDVTPALSRLENSDGERPGAWVNAWIWIPH